MLDFHELLFKRYNGKASAEDYVDWAEEMIYFDTEEIKMLASMRPPFQRFEIEAMFEKAVQSLGWEYPTEKECALFHIKLLHRQLLFASDEIFPVVQEIYNCTVQYELKEKQLQWHEPSEWIDQFHYDQHFHLSKRTVERNIIQHARELWHSEKSEYSFSNLLGQRVVAVDVESSSRFVVQFDNGSLMIECAWRIRNTETILMGDSDIHSEAMTWQDVQELLINKTIQDIQLWENCPFLMVQLDDLFIDVFHGSTLFEGWSLTDNEDQYLFSDHGGHIM